MTSHFFRGFFGIIAVTLSLSAYASAEELASEGELQEEMDSPPAQKSRQAAYPVKEEEPKRVKPHFAGVRRTPESVLEKKKSSKKVKNPWFTSKTQPKVDKKETIQSEPVELPEDRPYFTKANYVLAAAPALAAQKNASNSQNDVQEDVYPRTGFQAPAGHVFVTGEWLYWRTRQEGMEFATSKQIEFDFRSGFRVGAGAHLPSFDGWTIYANYTRFSPEHSHLATGSFFPFFLFQGATGVSGNTVTAAKGHWKIGFQSVDVEFGKAYYLSKTLVFSPFFGLKGAWIEQHAHFDYQGGYIPAGEVFSTHLKNDFKGAGPLLGTEMNWQLGAGFSFFGDVAAALVVGQFDNTQKQSQPQGNEVVHLADDFNLVSPTLQMAAGIGWDRNFHHDQCHFGLSLGFETQYWWSQNQTEQFVDDVRPVYVRQKGDLAFYGLTLKGRIDF